MDWRRNLDQRHARDDFQAFNCEVINSYGASEFMPLASERGHQKLHLNNDWAILEPVDEQYQPVPIGQAGSTTLLTN